MRYAMLSGHLAARSLMEGTPEKYDRLWRERFGGTLRAGIVNRYTFGRFGNFGYAKFLGMLDRSSSVRNWLRIYYALTFWKRLLYPIAHRAVRTSRKQAACSMKGCDCTWCRCQHQIAAA